MNRGDYRILTGDVLQRIGDIEPESVQACITSPPYWSLRDYQVEGQIGLEQTPEEYMAKLVQVFAGVRKALHKTGTLWLNLGDTYATDRGGTAMPAQTLSGSSEMFSVGSSAHRNAGKFGLKGGDLVNIPHRVATALQADGWYWRSTIIWAKKSPMPESVSGWRWMRCRVKVKAQWGDDHPGNSGNGKMGARGTGNYPFGSAGGKTPPANAAKWMPCPGCNKCKANGGLVLRKGKWRPTTGHEYLFLFSKSPDYFCDGDAVQELAVGNVAGNKRHKGADAFANGDELMRTKENLGTMGGRETRNPRSVWSLSSEGYKGAHFATYPTELVKRCLEAATPAIGCCSACMTPYAPIIDTERIPTRPGVGSKVIKAETKLRQSHQLRDDIDPEINWRNSTLASEVGNRDPQRHIAVTRVVGYRPACSCPDEEPVPCVVLDPFGGSGTTAQVATWYGRDAVICELNADYVQLAEERIATMPRCMAKRQKVTRKPVVESVGPSLFD